MKQVPQLPWYLLENVHSDTKHVMTNTKSQIPSSKQIQMTKIQMTKVDERLIEISFVF